LKFGEEAVYLTGIMPVDSKEFGLCFITEFLDFVHCLEFYITRRANVSDTMSALSVSSCLQYRNMDKVQKALFL
jgi:hypothetical protein